MNRNLEQAFVEQAGQLFAMCKAYMSIDEAMPPEAKAALKEEIAAAWEALDVDLMQLYEEIAANLEEPMSEQQRERYCFSLITPFKEYSSVLFPVWEIANYKESLARAKSDGKENFAELYTNLIAAAEARAERYKKMAFAGKYKPVDEAEKVYRKLAQRIGDYGRILDAAFVLSGLDLKRLQERCSVWVNDFSIPDRARQIGEIIGSEALALEYLNKLPQEQPEPQQEDLHYYCRKAIEKGYLQKTDTGYKKTKEITKAQLAYFLGHFPNPDGTFPDAEYSILFGESRLGKASSQLADNKNGNGKPRGYEVIDELLKL